MRELGLPKEDLSWIAGVVGTITVIAGSLVSAWAVRRWGLRMAIWPLTLIMNLNLWAYVWLAWSAPDPSATDVLRLPFGLADVSVRPGIWLIAAVHAYEQFAAGLGNAVLVVFIMRTCSPRYKAAHYAVATAVMSLGGTVIGGLGGLVVEAIGYTGLFLLAVVASLPSMGLLAILPIPEQAAASDVGRRTS
jgi:PAT family beta-lactamase induction signal transducer AmpG